jgi:glutamyl-tRNA synthetase
VKRLADDELGARLAPYLGRNGLDWRAGPSPAAVGALLRDRSATLADMADDAHYFYATPHPAPELVAERVADAVRPALHSLYELFESIEWDREAIHGAIRSAAAKHGVKPPPVMMALRALATGQSQTPAIDAIAALLGRATTRARMKAGLEL